MSSELTADWRRPSLLQTTLAEIESLRTALDHFAGFTRRPSLLLGIGNGRVYDHIRKRRPNAPVFVLADRIPAICQTTPPPDVFLTPHNLSIGTWFNLIRDVEFVCLDRTEDEEPSVLMDARVVQSLRQLLDSSSFVATARDLALLLGERTPAQFEGGYLVHGQKLSRPLTWQDQFRTRLEGFIDRMRAQITCLDEAASRLQALEGMVFELGFGRGRTYDHIARRFPREAITVFDVDYPPDCPSPTIVGDLRLTLPQALPWAASRVSLVHFDVVGGPEAPPDLAFTLASTIADLLSPCGIVVSNCVVPAEGLTLITPQLHGRADKYFMYSRLHSVTP